MIFAFCVPHSCRQKWLFQYVSMPWGQHDAPVKEVFCIDEPWISGRKNTCHTVSSKIQRYPSFSPHPFVVAIGSAIDAELILVCFYQALRDARIFRNPCAADLTYKSYHISNIKYDYDQTPGLHRCLFRLSWILPKIWKRPGNLTPEVRRFVQLRP